MYEFQCKKGKSIAQSDTVTKSQRKHKWHLEKLSKIEIEQFSNAYELFKALATHTLTALSEVKHKPNHVLENNNSGPHLYELSFICPQQLH